MSDKLTSLKGFGEGDPKPEKAAKSKAIHAKMGKGGHSELVKKFKAGKVGGKEVFESAMKHGKSYDGKYPL